MANYPEANPPVHNSITQDFENASKFNLHAFDDDIWLNPNLTASSIVYGKMLSAAREQQPNDPREQIRVIANAMISAIYQEPDDQEDLLSAGALILRNVYKISGAKIPKLLVQVDSGTY